MTKEHLTALIKEKAELETSAAARKTLDAILDSIKEGVSETGDVSIRRFGAFSVVDRAPRKGRNPKTGQPIDIPATRAVKFTPGEELKMAANAVQSGEQRDWLDFRSFAWSMNRQVKDFSRWLEDSGKKADRLGKEAKKYYQERLGKEKITEKYDDLRTRMRNMAHSGGEAWTEMRGGLEKAMSELKESFKRAISKL